MNGHTLKMETASPWVPNLKQLLVSVSGPLWAEMCKHLIEKFDAALSGFKGVFLFRRLLQSHLILEHQSKKKKLHLWFIAGHFLETDVPYQ